MLKIRIANATNATLQTSLDEEQEPNPSLAETTRLLNNLREAIPMNTYVVNAFTRKQYGKNDPKPKFCARCKTPLKEE